VHLVGRKDYRLSEKNRRRRGNRKGERKCRQMELPMLADEGEMMAGAGRVGKPTDAPHHHAAA
jgi:hypothetical protein